jgi:superfamily II DNA/RNA helicase
VVSSRPRQSGKLDLGCIRLFVIDEADRMADEENAAIVMDVFAKLPKVCVWFCLRPKRGACALDLGRAGHSFAWLMLLPFFYHPLAPHPTPTPTRSLPLLGCSQGSVAGEARLQVCFFSATLHSPEIKALSERICQHPTWVDLKVGAVPVTGRALGAVGLNCVGYKGVPLPCSPSQVDACDDVFRKLEFFACVAFRGCPCAGQGFGA